jgi:hypothetical protein
VQTPIWQLTKVVVGTLELLELLLVELFTELELLLVLDSTLLLELELEEVELLLSKLLLEVVEA